MMGTVTGERGPVRFSPLFEINRLMKRKERRMKIKGLFWKTICVTALALALALPSASVDAKTVITLGHAVEPGENYAHLTCVKFKELVEKYTNGEVTVEIYPSAQLGDEQELVRSIQMGTVQAAAVAVNNFNVYAPSLGYYTLPYMFKNEQEFRDLTDAMWDQNNKWAVDESGVRLLSVMEIGFRNLTNSKKPVRTMADLKGLKIRVPRNTIMVNAFASFGVEPVAVAFAELFNALQQGVLDGQEASYNIVTANKYYEAQKYATDIAYIIHSGCLVLSDKFYQNLTPEQQDAVTKAGKEAMMYERDFSDEMKKKDLEIMKKAGMELSGPPTDMEEWVKAGRSTWPAAYKIIGGGDEEKGKAILNQVEKIKSGLN